MPDFISKSKTAYNKKADDYDNTPEGRFTRNFQRLIASEIVLREDDNVLDVACGNGSLLAALNEKTPINGFGVDISDRMIANAVTKNLGMKFYVSGCEAMPLDDASMNVITVCAAYHHFPDPSAFAKEAARVLKANGRIYIAEIYLPSFLLVIVNPFVPLSKEGDVRFYSPKGIHRIFKRVGFEPVDVKIFGHIQIVSMKYKEQSL